MANIVLKFKPMDVEAEMKLLRDKFGLGQDIRDTEELHEVLNKVISVEHESLTMHGFERIMNPNVNQYERFINSGIEEFQVQYTSDFIEGRTNYHMRRKVRTFLRFPILLLKNFKPIFTPGRSLKSIIGNFEQVVNITADPWFKEMTSFFSILS